MHNAQLERLNRSMLQHLRSDQFCLVTEPLALRRKKLKEMRGGDWIDLGERWPDFYIRQGSLYLFRARLFREADEEKVRIERREAGLFFERQGTKYSTLEGRLALLSEDRVRSGAILDFPWRLSTHIHLFDEERLIAETELIRYSQGFALKIVELTYES